MDITTILIIIGAVILGLAIIWALVAIVGLIFVRKAAREMNTEFDKHFDRFNRF